jgi:lipoprotein-anchoring transpeptidase ErfK/SrfK
MNNFVRGGLLLLVALLAGCTSFREAMYDFRGLPPGKVAIVVDLADQRADLYSGPEVVLTAPVSTGREGHDTVPGRYRVIEKDIDHRSSVYGAYVANGYVVRPDVDVRKDPRPPGAQFVGAPMPYFLRVYGGVGMHAGYLPGYPASHGCIRMPEGAARRFYEAARVGTPVIVRR